MEPGAIADDINALYRAGGHHCFKRFLIHLLTPGAVRLVLE
jgi:hypothetical protein